MRILVCCPDWGVPLGGHAGSSVHLRSMASALADLGHDVRLLVSNISGPVQPDLPVETVPCRRLWPAIRDRIESFRDCSFAKTGAAASPAPLAPAQPDYETTVAPPSWKVRLYYQTVPRICDRAEELFLHKHHFARAVEEALASFRPHGLYERHALGASGVALAVNRFQGRPRPPRLLEVNACLADECAARGDLPRPFVDLAKWDEHRSWRQADRLFCVSHALRDTVLRAGVNPKRAIVAPNGVDTAAFSPELPRGTLRQRIGAAPGDILVGFLGSLSPGRGGEEFLRILAQALPLEPRIKGVVIGDGVLAGHLRQLVATLGLKDRVVFTGAQPHARVPLFLVDLDVAVACYPKQKDMYFSPMKVLEYLACGLPTVCGQAGQMRDLVQNGRTGVLVPPGDPAPWAEAVAALCRDPARRASLGQAARQQALAGPTWRNNAALVVQTVETLRHANGRNLP